MKSLNEEQQKVRDEVDKTMSDEVILEYIANTSDEDLDDLQEAYNGSFGSDKDFAMSLAEDIGEMPKESAWPLYCIDWEYAARELMMDYFEIGGFYFRNL
jgi:antirestriction protein